MTVIIYLKLAKTRRGYKVAASMNPNYAPLIDSYNESLPTIRFGIALAFDEDVFKTKVLPETIVPTEWVGLMESSVGVVPVQTVTNAADGEKDYL